MLHLRGGRSSISKAVYPDLAEFWIDTAAAYRKAHAADWETMSDIFSEAAEYWHDVHKPLWVFVG